MTTTDHPNSERSLGDLLMGLTADISTLFRKEIELAKAETSEKVSSMAHGGQMIAVGGVLALGALGVLLAAMVAALGAVFIEMGIDPTAANSLSAGIIGIVIGAIALALISAGVKRLKASNLKLERTAKALGDDVAAVREKI